MTKTTGMAGGFDDSIVRLMFRHGSYRTSAL